MLQFLLILSKKTQMGFDKMCLLKISNRFDRLQVLNRQNTISDKSVELLFNILRGISDHPV